MKNVLVVGATGQLGLKLCELLDKSVYKVIATYRSLKDVSIFGEDVVPIYADLKDYLSLLNATKNVDIIITTATVVFPSQKSSFVQDENIGYANLVKAAEYQRVEQIIFTSLSIPFDQFNMSMSKTYMMKKQCEDMMIKSKVSETIIRFPPFMDDYFALIGSEIPLTGEVKPTLQRSKGVTKLLRKLMKSSIEKYGIAFIPCDQNTSHAFISVDDVAQSIVSVVGNTNFYNTILIETGPEKISWKELVCLFENILQKKIKICVIPKSVLVFLIKFFRPFSEFLTNQLSVLYIVGITGTDVIISEQQICSHTKKMSPMNYLRDKYSEWSKAKF